MDDHELLMNLGDGQLLSSEKENHERQIGGVEVDLSRLTDKRYAVKKISQILTNPNRPMDSGSVQWRVNLIRELEGLLKTDFKCTKDFKEKIGKFLEGYEVRKADPPKRIRRARKKLKLTQKELAEKLGYKNHVPIAQFELGKRYPTGRVFQWLETMGM